MNSVLIMEPVEELVWTGEATIVDVRTEHEFRINNVSGSINIPLHELAWRLDELRQMNMIVLCCASGARSAQAAAYLKSQGIDCYDAGPMSDVLMMINF